MSHELRCPRPGRLLLAGLAFFSLLGNAHAQATASFVTEVSYSLIDLNPLDGFAPSITFADGTTSSYTVSYSASVAAGGGSSAAGATTHKDFTLGANSAVVFSFQSTYSAQSAGTVGWSTSSSTDSEARIGSFSYNISGVGATGDGVQSSSKSFSGVTVSNEWSDMRYNDVSGQWEFLHLAGSATGSAAFTGAFVNLTNGDLSGGVSTNAQVDAFDVSPVPEPSTAAMALAGLGLLAWRRRRHAEA